MEEEEEDEDDDDEEEEEDDDEEEETSAVSSPASLECAMPARLITASPNRRPIPLIIVRAYSTCPSKHKRVRDAKIREAARSRFWCRQCWC